MSESSSPLRRTPLHDLHVEWNGRMVDFSGWSLPVRYDPGPVAEHLHTRTAASLFDVSHMGIVELHGPSLAAAAEALEALVPADLVGLAPGRQRYTTFLTPQAGVIDDLMVAATGAHLTLVVNASRREVCRAHLAEFLDPSIEVVERDEMALVAVQGPEAVAALSEVAPGVEALGFMAVDVIEVAGVSCRVSRSGYTGEDGVEIQIPGPDADAVVRALLARPAIEPAGLAARDSLRLEAGLCLYGNDLTEEITPIEAGLAWTIPGRRRSEGGYPGADVVADQLANGTGRVRVGLRTEGRQPVRTGTDLVTAAGDLVGRVTSGGYGPTFGGPIAMGYVSTALASPETPLMALERGRELPVLVTALPFVARRYHRPSSQTIFQERS
ncbi:MAG: glycine cleavage system aminomethyltransferase GcvT [Acidimicrobiales bacterium]